MLFYSAHGRARLSKGAMIASVTALTGAAPRAARLAMRNTLDYTDDAGVRRIRLHDTDVLTIFPRGGFVVDTGGWNTMVTRDRLNGFLPAPWSVFTSAARLHLRNRETGEVVPFNQRVEVKANGAIKPDMTEPRLNKLRRDLDAYITAWKIEGLPPVSEAGGDPWISPQGGKVAENTMLDWIRSRYVFRSLMAYALAYCGIQPRGVAMMLDMIDRRGGKLDRTDLRRLRRYCRACLGLEA